ncbi:hypothetical protein CYR32_20070 [Chimaeribacter coloradensis]|uniref:Fimbrial-type adhesion domain-containing protein n=1 Tax=Chimaeribacter coloradensis TaxID=2060068 RepID=A0A2N5DTH9_9GAMM|nr:fimbrial protein [Chimaeribacter coloradensis]PLR29764.1 hypothetical protein CYR32_20070 [Chimaeribacter coloradensis]
MRLAKVSSAGVLLAALLGSRTAWAGGCVTPDEPMTYGIELRQGRNILDDPGMVVPDMSGIDSGDVKPMDCRCEGGSAPLYFKAVVTLPPGYNDGTMTYYIVHPTVQIGLKYRVNNGPLIPAPFEDVSDGVSHDCGSDGFYHSPVVETGMRATLSLYLARGFTGKVVIPPAVLGTVYARWGTQGGYGATYVNRVFIFGELTATQTCRINDGAIINIDLGTLLTDNILTPGALPAHYTPQQIRLELMCRNFYESMQVSLTLYGNESAELPGVLQTSNPDIGVQVTDQNMKPFNVNGGQVPLTLDYSDIDHEPGHQLLYAWPVNTTGKRPASGPFSALALLEVEIQ